MYHKRRSDEINITPVKNGSVTVSERALTTIYVQMGASWRARADARQKCFRPPHPAILRYNRRTVQPPRANSRRFLIRYSVIATSINCAARMALVNLTA